MLDLETLSSDPGPAIIAIGCVPFDPYGNFVGIPLSINVEFNDAVNHGVVSGSTIRWWFTQSNEAREGVIHQSLSLDMALSQLISYINQYGPCTGIWGNGVDFDVSAIEHAFNRMGIRIPWSYKAHRDFRTMRALCPDVDYKTFIPQGAHHNAAQDALGQARALQEIMRRLGITGSV